MRIIVNGTEIDTLEPRLTVAELLERYGLSQRAVAVEVNEELVPKGRHAQRELNDCDRVEFVTLVGGG